MNEKHASGILYFGNGTRSLYYVVKLPRTMGVVAQENACCKQESFNCVIAENCKVETLVSFKRIGGFVSF